MVSNSAVAYQRAVAHEEARMRSQTSKDTKARRVQEQFDRRLSQILTGCDRRKEALFRNFSQDRKQLN